MLAEMKYINTSHSFPVVASRSRLSTLSTPIDQATGSSDIQMAKSNQHATLVTIDIDSYPSRHAYGARTSADFSREQAEKGESDIAQATSRHTQEAMQNIESVGKKGASARAVAAYTNQFWSSVSRSRRIEAQAIPDPTITVNPSRVEGEPDTGKCEYSIDTHAGVPSSTEFNEGSFELYTKDKGYIRRWISIGGYDTNA
ncbi:MAG: DUF6470 family protein [Selenomonadaceae bacterium]|nr:DUF6470 family protein [Selenomonadaceae bacterium]